jgi:hypothetical protein
MKKLSALVFIFIFCIGYSQVSEFQKADQRYTKKIKALMKKYPKANDERTKQEWQLTEEKITAYKNTLEKIAGEEEKIDKDIPPPVMPKITKEAVYETGAASFREHLNKAVDISFLHYSSGSYKATLNFIVDSKGNIYGADVKGKNQDIDTFVLAAFYRIKDKGKWKPAESLYCLLLIFL